MLVGWKRSPPGGLGGGCGYGLHRPCRERRARLWNVIGRERMRRSGAQLFLACVGFLQACGTAASYGYSAPEQEEEQVPLLTLTGVVQDKSGQTVDLNQTRAALVWFPLVPGTTNQVPQDVGKTKAINTRFQIDVLKAPLLPETIRDQF